MSNIMTQPKRTFAFEILMYLSAVFLSFVSSMRMREIFTFQQTEPTEISFWSFIFQFLFITGIIVLIVYFFRSKKFKAVFFKIFFLLAVFLGNLYFFGLWLPVWAVFPLIGVLMYFLIKKPTPIIHNLVFITAVAGIASVVGMQLTPRVVIFLLLIFSVYDFIAVYKTKHMVKMAEAMVENRAIVGLIIPQKTADFKSNLKKMPIRGNFMILGGGDVVFPLIFAVSVLTAGILQFFIIIGFSLLGLLAVFLIFISKKQRAPMPALPPIALACIIGYAVTKLI